MKRQASPVKVTPHSELRTPNLPPVTHSDVACTLCGCVCDDLRVTVEGERVTKAEGACSLAEPWFLAQGSRNPSVAEIEGQPVELADAIVRAAKILSAARSPLIYGLSRSSTPGQRAAVRLADRLGATIDTTASLCHAPSIMAIQEVGESTCSLGEIRNRADLVLYWGADPLVTHPRHMERYAVDPLGLFVPNGKADRTVVVLDHERTATAEQADLFIPIPPGRNFETIWTLRMLLAGHEPSVRGDSPPLGQLADLLARMKSCRCGVVFFGLGLARSAGGHRSVEALLRLVEDLNAYTRFHAKRLRMAGDVTGADSVLCWQTGYPFAVNLARGYPRYNPGEYSAADVLARGEAGACLLVGSEGLAEFPPAALARLEQIPVIALEHAASDGRIVPTVRFTTDVYGIHRPGTAYRMDEVPIPLRAFLPRRYPSDDEVLGQILALLGR